MRGLSAPQIGCYRAVQTSKATKLLLRAQLLHRSNPPFFSEVVIAGHRRQLERLRRQYKRPFADYDICRERPKPICSRDCLRVVPQQASIERPSSFRSQGPQDPGGSHCSSSSLSWNALIPPARLPFPAARLGWECSATMPTRSRKAARTRQARKARRRSCRCNPLPSRPRLGRRNRRDCRPN